MRNIVVVFLFFISIAGIKAQEKEREKDDRFFKSENFFLGGSLGANVGSMTFIDLSPILGYRFTKKFSAGPGVIYQYMNYKDRYISLETSIYGGRFFTEYRLVDNLEEFLPIGGGINHLFVHGEYEFINYDREIFGSGKIRATGRTWHSNTYLGVGIISMFSARSGVSIMFLYNLTPMYASPYSNPSVRLSFIF